MCKKVETEIKLLGQYNNQLKYSNDTYDDSIKKIKNLLKILHIKSSMPISKYQSDTYFDTSDNKLLGMNYSARVRKINKENTSVTLKSPVEEQTENKLQALARKEDEYFLEPNKNAKAFIEDLVATQWGILDIQEKLVVHTIRNVIPIETQWYKYELCFDKYNFYNCVQNKKSEDYYEIEIESDKPIQSTDEQISQLTAIFTQILGFTGSSISKYQRGIDWSNRLPDYTNKQFLAFDIVKYSTKQSYIQKEMIVKFTSLIDDVLKDMGLNSKTLKLPTGDGMFLCFDESRRILPLLGPILQKLAEINLNYQPKDRIDIRTSLHYGSVFEYQDINNHKNYAGMGINFTARIIGHAQKHQVLISEDIYNYLYQQNHICIDNVSKPFTICVKHDVLLTVRNYYDSYLNIGIPYEADDSVNIL